MTGADSTPYPRSREQSKHSLDFDWDLIDAMRAADAASIW